MGLLGARRIVDAALERGGAEVPSEYVGILLLALDSAGLLIHPDDAVDPNEWLDVVEKARRLALDVVVAETENRR